MLNNILYNDIPINIINIIDIEHVNVIIYTNTLTEHFFFEDFFKYVFLEHTLWYFSVYLYIFGVLIDYLK